MITQNERTLTVIITRVDDRYFYSSQVTGEPPNEKQIDRVEARNIVTNNPNGKTTSGRLDFSEQPSLGWTWTVSYGVKT